MPSCLFLNKELNSFWIFDTHVAGILCIYFFCIEAFLPGQKREAPMTQEANEITRLSEKRKFKNSLEYSQKLQKEHHS